MEKFYCDIWEQKINENQCFLRIDPLRYVNNSCCLNCPKHKDFTPSESEKTLKVSSAQLKAFAQKDFQSTLRFEEKQNKDRKVIRRMWKRKESTERIQSKRAGKVREKNYEPTSIRESVIRGKDKTYPNLLVSKLNYLLNEEIRKENQEVIEELKIYNKADVYQWISSLFTANGYRKHNGENYTGNDIKRIVESLDEKENSLNNKDLEETMRKYFRSFCNYELEDFCKRT